MLMPKFHIKHILMAMTLLAGLCVFVKFAIDGQLWAVSLCVGLAALATIFIVYALTFLAASPLILVDATLRLQQPPTTPFATNEPPPQILPPQEPE
jgi:hypothetical protein